MRIGHRNNRSLQTPNNQGMARRVDNRLDVTVDAQAARFKTALAVDGSVAFIFNKMRGVIPCTCRGSQNLKGFPRHEIGATGHEVKTGDIATHSARDRSAFVHTSSGSVEIIDTALERNDLDNFFKLKNTSIVDKIEENVDGFVDDPSQDILDALNEDTGATTMYSGDGDPMKDIIAATNLGNSSNKAFSPNHVACPICFGSGYVDSWMLYNGNRICLDASDKYDVSIVGDVDVDTDAQPFIFSVFERGSVVWQNIPLPTMWRLLLRLVLYKGREVVSLSDYKLYFTHASNPSVKNELTFHSLSQLNNGQLLRQSNKVDIYLENATSETLVFTHLEAMFSLGYPVRIQVPEVEVPNEDEYVDWNLNVTFELPSDIEIKENSYLVESKYRRVWKVGQVNRKLSARGKSFGYSVGARPLHSFENRYAQMNVFGRPSNPFANNELQTYDPD